MLSRVKSSFSFVGTNKHSDFKSIFMPMYIPLSLIGIFPYSVSFNLKGCSVIKKSIYLNALNAVTINLVILAFTVYHLQHIVANTESSNYTKAVTAEYNYILEILNLNIAVIAIYIWAYKNSFNYIKVLNTLASSWNELPRTGNRVFGKLYTQIQVFLVAIVIILIFMILINVSRDDTYWKLILVTVSFTVPMTIQFMMIGFYCYLILMVEASLAIINENCLNIIKDRRSPIGYFIKVENRSATVTLRHLELVYVKVIAAKRTINSAFQAPIMFTLLQCFHCLISKTYAMYHGIIVKKTFTLHETIDSSLWAFYQALKVFALSYTGNKLKCEAIKIGQNLHNIPADRVDPRMLLEIQHFSSLMWHQSPDLAIYGFFAIDATLIFNVMTSAAMYLIILIQFEEKE